MHARAHRGFCWRRRCQSLRPVRCVVPARAIVNQLKRFAGCSPRLLYTADRLRHRFCIFEFFFAIWNLSAARGGGNLSAARVPGEFLCVRRDGLRGLHGINFQLGSAAHALRCRSACGAAAAAAGATRDDHISAVRRLPAPARPRGAQGCQFCLVSSLGTRIETMPMAQLDEDDERNPLQPTSSPAAGRPRRRLLGRRAGVGASGPWQCLSRVWLMATRCCLVSATP